MYISIYIVKTVFGDVFTFFRCFNFIQSIDFLLNRFSDLKPFKR